MSRKNSRIWPAIVVGILFFGPVAIAQTTVKLQIDDPPSDYVMDGIYVGSYTASNLSNGGSVQITCDDFKDESNSSPYSYNVNTFSSLGNTLWGQYFTSKHEQSLILPTYDEAAWLTEAMLGKAGSQKGYYSYAIWAITDASGVASWLIGRHDWTACTQVFGNSKCAMGTHAGLVWDAESQKYTAGEFSNIRILTPEGCSNPGNCKEQEFLEVVPEGGSAALYLLLAGTACFAAMFLRSRQRSCVTGPAS